MLALPRLASLSVIALSCATPAVAQQAGDDDFGIDWSVGLRGSYSANSLTGGQASVLVTPEASLTLRGESNTTNYTTGAELVVDSAGAARVASLRAVIDSSYRLGPTTLLDGAVDGRLTQADPGSSGLPANTLAAPLVFDGTVRGSWAQDMGRLDARLTLDGARRISGPTTLNDLTIIDNGSRSFWEGGTTLRLGYEITPLLSTFVEGETSVQKYDAADPTLMKYLDGRLYQLRAGVSYVHGSIIAAEASIGRGWLDYFDGTISDTQDWVYNGSLTLRPDETLSLNAALDTGIGPSETVSGDTDLDYRLTATARYEVNPWLTLRASAGWDRTLTLGTGTASWGYDLGAGLDYRSSRSLVWTADYVYARDHEPPIPTNDTHTILLGARLQR